MHSSSQAMDVPYNKSGASSRVHYQVVRNVENATDNVEEILLKEVDRIKQRIVQKMVSTSDLRKDLIILLYCLNSSGGSVSPPSLAFALPSAVHLAEAGTKVSERWIGHLFCSEVMPKGNELELMLVNTIRKDLYSSSLSRIALALESLITSPSVHIISSVYERCLELLAHPSVRLKVLSMHALYSLSHISPEILRNGRFKNLIIKRLSDGEETVVRAALKIGKELAEKGKLAWDNMTPPSISLLLRLADKTTAKQYSSACVLTVLRFLIKLLSVKELESRLDELSNVLPSVMIILRRAVKHEKQSIILESFCLLGAFPPSIVAKYIADKKSIPSETATPSEDASKISQNKLENVEINLRIPTRSSFVHPVALIRHFLSSRVVNDHYLFLSCLSQLEPILWAGIGQTTQEQSSFDQLGSNFNIPVIEPVLDQWEVERVLGSLESDDEGIRKLTLRILGTLEPALLEGCFERSLHILQTFSDVQPEKMNKRARQATLIRTLELVYALSLGDPRSKDIGTNKGKGKGKEKASFAGSASEFTRRLRQVTEALGSQERVEKTVVDFVLNTVREEDQTDLQRSCILELLSAVDPPEPVDLDTSNTNNRDKNKNTDIGGTDTYKKKYDATLLLALLALLCEFAFLFSGSQDEVVRFLYRLTNILKNCSASMQEPTILCLTRFAALLSPIQRSQPSQPPLTAQEPSFNRKSLLNILKKEKKKQRGLISKRYTQLKTVLKEPASVNVLLKVQGQDRNRDQLQTQPISVSVSLPEFALTLDQMILPDDNDNEVDDSDNPLFDEENESKGEEEEEEGGDLFYTPSSDPRLI